MSYYMGENGQCIHCEKNFCECAGRTRLFFLEDSEIPLKEQAKQIAGENELAFELALAAFMGYKVSPWMLDYLKREIELDRKMNLK